MATPVRDGGGNFIEKEFFYIVDTHALGGLGAVKMKVVEEPSVLEGPPNAPRMLTLAAVIHIPVNPQTQILPFIHKIHCQENRDLDKKKAGEAPTDDPPSLPAPEPEKKSPLAL
jgi:hypothetical protein